MKSILIKHLFRLFISFLTFGAYAQCPNVTNFNTTYGPNGTATVTPIFSDTLNQNYFTYNWINNGNMNFTNGNSQPSVYIQTTSNRDYMIWLTTYNPISNCTSTNFTIIHIVNTASTSCNATFTSNIDSNCVTHFSNTSIGNDLSFEWISVDNNGVNNLISTQSNPQLPLRNGPYKIELRLYTSGQFCYVVSDSLLINCPGNPAGDVCHSSFYTYTDSSCYTHFINTSTYPVGNYSAQWNVNGNIYNNWEPILNLPNGIYNVTLSMLNTGNVCDSISQQISVSCNMDSTSTTPCQVNSNFTIFPDSTNAGNYFAYNLSSGNGNLSYLWDFGDGTTSLQQYPTHQYGVPGQYIICLTVTSLQDSTSCSDTYCDSSSVQKIASGFLMSQISIIPQSTTGVKKLTKPLNVVAYPNPINNELIVEISKEQPCKYVITDAIGKLILNGTLTQSKSMINTSNLEKGFYNLMIIDYNNQSVNIKLVK